jgi:O-antigen/teichoic acid export membrane protein
VGGFITGAIVARALGPGLFAVYTVGFTIFSSLMQLTTFAETWLVSRWGDSRNLAAAKRVVWQIKLWTALASIGIASLVGVLAPGVVARFGINTLTLAIAVAAAGGAALSTAGASTFQAEQNFTAYATIVAVSPLVGAALSAAFAFMGVSNPAVYLAAIAFSYCPTATLAYFRLRSEASDELTVPLMKSALRFGGWVTIGSLAYVLFQRVDVFLLAAHAPQEAVGSYGVAARLGMIAAVFGNTITTILMPTGSRSDTWATPELRRAYSLESAVSVGVTFAFVGLAALATPLIIRSVFGVRYLDAVDPTRVLLLSQAIVIAQMPFYFALYALNGARWIAALGVAQLAAATGVGYLLVARYGALGAAWSNVLTYTLGAFVVAAFHWRRRPGLQALA